MSECEGKDHWLSHNPEYKCRDSGYYVSVFITKEERERNHDTMERLVDAHLANAKLSLMEILKKPLILMLLVLTLSLGGCQIAAALLMSGGGPKSEPVFKMPKTKCTACNGSGWGQISQCHLCKGTGAMP